MATFVVCEIWIRHRVIEADDQEEALDEAYDRAVADMHSPDPSRRDDLSLANWYATEFEAREAEK